MDKQPASSLVPAAGGGRSGDGEAKGEHGSGGFLDLSLGSIYNNPSLAAADGCSPPVARALHASAPLASGVAAATAANAPPAPASSAPAAFALGLAASAVADDGNVDGSIVVAASALAVAHQDNSVLPLPLPPLFASDGSGIIPVTVPVTASATVPAARDSGATLAPQAVASGATPPPLSSAPLPPKPRRPRNKRRDNAGGRRSQGGDNADASSNDGESVPPFPWAAETAAAHPTLAQLAERGVLFVEGDVRCKRCDSGKTMSYEIKAKFGELCNFIVRNVQSMYDRAPPEWMYPALPDCDKCGQKNSLRPVIAAEKGRINWMFLLLGQMLGLCTLEQLKQFCAHTRQHRTGAKDRVLYSTYMELCNQLCPNGPFDMASERKNRMRPFS